jgi:crossover junction endodeoxyribonuclease RuvC
MESTSARCERTRTAPVVVLGIDPGTLVVGYGAVVDHARAPRLYAAGVLRAPRSEAPAERLARLRDELDRLLARLAPAVVVVEQAFAARNVRSALRIGEGRGVALACAAASGARVVELAPAAAKKALVGHGAADKTQVARMVAQALSIEELDLPLDASDALALALAHLSRSRLESLVGPGAAVRRVPAPRRARA